MSEGSFSVVAAHISKVTLLIIADFSIMRRPSSAVIKHFSCSTQLSKKFVHKIHLKSLTIANSFMLKIPEMNISLLINMKMPTIVGIFIFIGKKKKYAQVS